MLAAVRSTSFRISHSISLAIGLLGCLALIGCGEVEPSETEALEAIRALQASGNFEASISPLRELLTDSPDDGEANFLYGRAMARTAPHLAVWSLRKAMLDPEWFSPAGAQIAMLELAGENYHEVTAITTRILEREPENLRVLMMRANAYAHSKRDPELAIADAERILEIDPTATEAYEPLILGLISLERLDEASEALEKAGKVLRELGTGDVVLAWHCATTGTFQQQSGDLERARETWQGCVDAYPTDLDVVTSSMAFYDSLAEPQQSLAIVSSALEAEPSSRFFRTTVAQRLIASGDVDGAEALLREPTNSQDPHLAAAAWIDVGQLEQALGDYGAGADSLGKAVALMEGMGSVSPQMRFEYADALLLAGRLELALEVAEDLSVPAHGNMIRGRVAQERREPALALEEFEEGLRLWPDNPWARYYAALAAEELGDFDRAIEEYRNAVRVQPGATDARMRGATLLLAQGNPAVAGVMLQTEIGKAPLESEGLLLGMHVAGRLGDTASIAAFLEMVEASHPAWAGRALEEAARGLAEREGPRLAMDMLAKAPVDFRDPRFAAGLRAWMRYAHTVGELSARRAAFDGILAFHPESSRFQDIRALDLELSGAPADEVRAAYARAVELGPGNAWALMGLGRVLSESDPEEALALFDRAAAANPIDAEPKLLAARLAAAAVSPAAAAERLDALLLAHPTEVEAALERARLDVDQQIATEATLERAQRALRFGGGADALDILSQVHALRDETELASQAAARARALRESSREKR